VWIDEDNGVPRELDIELKFVTDGDQAFKLQKEIAGISRAAGSATVINLPADFGSDRVIPNGAKIILQNARPTWLNDTVFVMESKRRASNFDVDIALREYAGDSTFVIDAPIPAAVVNPVPVRAWVPRVSATFPTGVAETIVREVNGVILIDDINLTGRGLASSELDALNTNVTAAVSSGGGLYATVTGNATSAGNAGSATTSALTASGNAGTAPYTYTWTVTGGFAVDTPNSATTTFSATVPVNGNVTGQATCIVTDDTGATAQISKSVTAIDVNSGGGGPIN